MEKKILLNDILRISTGYPFRKKIEPVHKGIPVIQMKDVDMREGLNSKNLVSTELPYRSPTDWVENNDILFIAKGNQHFASLVKGLDQKAVCTPHFFHMKIKSKSALPDYIVWLLNQRPLQQYFSQVSEGGSSSKFIKKSLIANINLILPSLSLQKEIVQLNELIRLQTNTLEEINKQHINKLNLLSKLSLGEV